MEYKFDDILGYDQQKETLRHVCKIIDKSELYHQRGIKLPVGIVIYGPGDNGEGLFVNALAQKCCYKLHNLDFTQSQADEFALERLAKKIQDVKKSKQTRNLLYIRNLDKVLPSAFDEGSATDLRKAILRCLEQFLDNVEFPKQTMVVATCQSYLSLPKSLTSFGRMDTKIYLPNPDYKTRVLLLKHLVGKSDCFFHVEPKVMARLTRYLSCAQHFELIAKCERLCNLSSQTRDVFEDVIQQVVCQIKGEDFPNENPISQRRIQCCKNVGSFVVARLLNSGGYTLTSAPNAICNDFLERVVRDGVGLDPYEFDQCTQDGFYVENGYVCNHHDEYLSDEDDYDDNCEDENPYGFFGNKNQRVIQNCCFFNKNDYLDAITTLYGGYVACQSLLGNTYSCCGAQLQAITQTLLKMSRCGLLGVENVYSDERAMILPYTKQFCEKINSMFETLQVDCYKKAQAIVNANVRLIKTLVPILMSQDKIKYADCEMLINEFGGIANPLDTKED